IPRAIRSVAVLSVQPTFLRRRPFSSVHSMRYFREPLGLKTLAMSTPSLDPSHDIRNEPMGTHSYASHGLGEPLGGDLPFQRPTLHTGRLKNFGPPPEQAPDARR